MAMMKELYQDLQIVTDNDDRRKIIKELLGIENEEHLNAECEDYLRQLAEDEELELIHF